MVATAFSRLGRRADPYRATACAEILEAPTRDGPLRLEIGPRHASLALAAQHLSITAELLTLHETGGRGRRTELRLPIGDTRRLIVARSVPHEELGLWFERKPGVMRRIFGVRPVALVEDSALDAWRALDAVARRLREVVHGPAAEVTRALELGRGADRVLLLDHGDRHVMYQRLLFREHARRTLEVHADGTIVQPREAPRGGGAASAPRIACRSRHGVTVLGDYIRFADPSGFDVARAAVPWVAPEDRLELARRFGELVER
jgi:hypothetical protein